MTIKAWYMDDDEEADQRLPHHKEDVGKELLDSLGKYGSIGVEDTHAETCLLRRA
jgi:hypothetical protein